MKKKILYLTKSYFQLIFGFSVISYLVIIILFIFFVGEYPLKYIWNNKYQTIELNVKNYQYMSTSKNMFMSIPKISHTHSIKFVKRQHLYKSENLVKSTTQKYRHFMLFFLQLVNKFQFLDEKTIIYSGYWDERYIIPKGSHYVRVMALLKSNDDINLQMLKGMKFSSFFKYNNGKIYNTDDSTYVCLFLTPLMPTKLYNFSQTNYLSNGELYETCENHRMEWGTFYISCQVPKSYLSMLSGLDKLSSIHSINMSIYNLKKPSIRVNLTVNIPSSLSVYRDKLKALDTWRSYQTLTITNYSSAAICVPPLYGNISAHAIVQFMEMSKLLGASMAYFYLTTNDTKSYPYLSALKHYEDRGEATLYPWFLPLPYPTRQIWNYGQSLSIGDCLYRNMYRHDLLAFNDIDEFLIPPHHDTWQHMAQDQRYWPFNVSGLKARGAFYEMPPTADNRLVEVYYNTNYVPDKAGAIKGLSLYPVKRDKTNIPPTHNIFNMIRRTALSSRVRTKCLVKARLIFEQGIHHVSKQAVESVPPAEAPVDALTLHHYRQCSRGYDMNCRDYVLDYGLGRYAKRFATNYATTWQQIINTTISP